MKETWKPIKNYEGLYEVSNKGQVRSLNYKRTGEIKILKLRVNKYGYLQVHLSKNGKHYAKSIHRLVAQTFIPNPNNYSQVNHKDEKRDNNNVENLEWCNCKYNNNYGNRNKKISESISGEKHFMYGKHHTESTKNKLRVAFSGVNNPMYGMKGDKSPVAKKVKCVNTGEIFNSIREAGDFCNMKHPSNISECCKGKRKTAGKHPVTGEKLIWEYLMP